MTAGEDLGMRRKKIRYRAWHRGTREMDLVLGPFADAYTEAMDAGELDQLEKLMCEEDPHLLKWVMGQEVPPPTVNRALLERVIEDHKARVSEDHKARVTQ
jgi:antitoxin CptB